MRGTRSYSIMSKKLALNLVREHIVESPEGKRSITLNEEVLDRLMGYLKPKARTSKATDSMTALPSDYSARKASLNESSACPPQQSSSDKYRKIHELQVFQSIKESCGFTDDIPVGSGLWKRVMSCLKELFLLTPNLTASEVKLRVANYRSSWPNISVTPESIKKHWSAFASKKQVQTEIPDNLV